MITGAVFYIADEPHKKIQQRNPKARKSCTRYGTGQCSLTEPCEGPSEKIEISSMYCSVAGYAKGTCHTLLCMAK
jgi:hypothetical protein